MALFLLENRDFPGFRMIFKVRFFKLYHNAMFHKIQIKFDYGEIDLYRSWIMALFLLEDGDFLGFRMIFKVWLDQIFSIFNTMLLTIKYRLGFWMKIWNAGYLEGGQIVYVFWKRTIWVHTWGLWQCRIVCYLQGINFFCIYNATSRYIDSLYQYAHRFFSSGGTCTLLPSFLGVHPNFWGCNVPSNSSFGGTKKMNCIFSTQGHAPCCFL